MYHSNLRLRLETHHLCASLETPRGVSKELRSPILAMRLSGRRQERPSIPAPPCPLASASTPLQHRPQLGRRSSHLKHRLPPRHVSHRHHLAPQREHPQTVAWLVVPGPRKNQLPARGDDLDGRLRRQCAGRRNGCCEADAAVQCNTSCGDLCWGRQWLRCDSGRHKAIYCFHRERLCWRLINEGGGDGSLWTRSEVCVLDYA